MGMRRGRNMHFERMRTGEKIGCTQRYCTHTSSRKVHKHVCRRSCLFTFCHAPSPSSRPRPARGLAIQTDAFELRAFKCHKKAEAQQRHANEGIHRNRDFFRFYHEEKIKVTLCDWRKQFRTFWDLIESVFSVSSFLQVFIIFFNACWNIYQLFFCLFFYIGKVIINLYQDPTNIPFTFSCFLFYFPFSFAWSKLAIKKHQWHEQPEQKSTSMKHNVKKNKCFFNIIHNRLRWRLRLLNYKLIITTLYLDALFDA